MRNAARLFLFLVCLSVPVALSAQQVKEISADQAGANIGKTVKVCGDVITAAYAPDSEGSPTLLRVGGTYPNQRINVVIWGENRDKWSTTPEEMYRGHAVCATGKIELYTGAPSIIATDPSSIQIQESGAQ